MFWKPKGRQTSLVKKGRLWRDRCGARGFPRSICRKPADCRKDAVFCSAPLPEFRGKRGIAISPPLAFDWCQCLVGNAAEGSTISAHPPPLVLETASWWDMGGTLNPGYKFYYNSFRIKLTLYAGATSNRAFFQREYLTCWYNESEDARNPLVSLDWS